MRKVRLYLDSEGQTGASPAMREHSLPKPLLDEAAKEEWKQIGEFPSYEVSNRGRIRRTTYLTTYVDSNSYLAVQLWDGNRKYPKRVHRLVAKAFLPNPLNLPEVNHKHFDTTCADVRELEWSSRLDNAQHAWRERRERRIASWARGQSSGLSRLTDPQVECIRRFKGTRWRVASMARHFGVSIPTLGLVLANKIWRHIQVQEHPRPYAPNMHRAKLHAFQAECARRLGLAGVEHAILAGWFHVSRPAITMLINGTTWQNSVEPKKSELVSCLRCGYRWRRRREPSASQCPKCRRRDWDKEPTPVNSAASSDQS